MKKLWFGLFAFVLSVCCGFALLHGSYTRSNLIAHSNAYYVSDDIIQSTYTDLNWQSVSDIYVPSYTTNTKPIYYNGSWYQFNGTIQGDTTSTINVTITDATDGSVSTQVLTFTDSAGYGDMTVSSRTSFISNGYYYLVDEYGFLSYPFSANSVEIDDVIYSTVILSDVSYVNGSYFLIGEEYFYLINGSSVTRYSFDGSDLEYGDLSFVDRLYRVKYVVVDDYFYFCAPENNENGYYLVCFDYVNGGIVSATSISGDYSLNWFDGTNLRYDDNTTHYVLGFDGVKTDITWVGYTGSFNSDNIYVIDDAFYLLVGSNLYVLDYSVPYVSPYPNVLAEMIALITSGIAGIAEGIGANLSVLAESVMIDANTGNLSAFGSLVVIMAGLALALHLCRWVVNFVTSLGRRDR